MALIYPDRKLLILLPPKCGAGWKQALLRSMRDIVGMPDTLPKCKAHREPSHATLAEVFEARPETRDYTIISGVRRPDTWVESHWCMMMERGWNWEVPYRDPVKLLQRDKVMTFRNYIGYRLKNPGRVDSFLMDYIEHDGREADIVVRMEDLPLAFRGALSLVGIRVTRSPYIHAPILNRGNPYWKNQCYWRPVDRDEFERNEGEIYRRFYGPVIQSEVKSER